MASVPSASAEISPDWRAPQTGAIEGKAQHREWHGVEWAVNNLIQQNFNGHGFQVSPSAYKMSHQAVPNLNFDALVGPEKQEEGTIF